MFDLLLDPSVWVAFLTLSFLEIILGIDNVIFITLLANKVPEKSRDKVRKFGLMVALVTRILLLLSLSWVMSLTNPLFNLLSMEISGRDLILFFGGAYLIWKATKEIYEEIYQNDSDSANDENSQSIFKNSKHLVLITALQIGIIDIVFSLDSVITAIGLVNQIPIMVAAIVVSIIVMLIAVKPIGDFVNKYPSFKILALSFLVLVGVILVGESFEIHTNKSYLYFAMFFSLFVELLNLLRIKKKLTIPNFFPFIHFFFYLFFNRIILRNVKFFGNT